MLDMQAVSSGDMNIIQIVVLRYNLEGKYSDVGSK